MATAKPKESPLFRPKTAFDLLSIPILGTAFKSRYGCLILQIPFLVMSVRAAAYHIAGHELHHLNSIKEHYADG